MHQITIPSSVKSILDYSFAGCSSLAQFIIPFSIILTGCSIFIGCSLLNYISVPSSIKTFGIDAFYWCLFLSKFQVPNSAKLIPHSKETNSYKRLSIDFILTNIDLYDDDFDFHMLE